MCVMNIKVQKSQINVITNFLYRKLNLKRLIDRKYKNKYRRKK